MFNKIDKQKTGKIDESKMQTILMKSKLDREKCEKIWDIVNPNLDEVFSKQQFFLSMAIIDRARQGEPVPKELPPALIESVFNAAESPLPKMPK